MLERAPLFRDLVFHAHGRLGHDDARHDPFVLELAQAFRQHAIADVGDAGAQLREAHPFVKQEVDDGTGPASADELDGVVELLAQMGLQTHCRQV
jgi:hypothetical protein